MAEIISTVTETTRDNSVRTPPQRSNFYAEGRYWVFYVTGRSIFFRSRPEIGSWSPETSIDSADMGADFSIWFDGAYIHYTRTRWGTGDNVYYRRGIPQPDGTIGWSAVEQVVYYSGGNKCGDPVVTVDSNGYPYIAFLLVDAVTKYIIVLKSSVTDGTWVQDWVAELYSGGVRYLPSLVPLTLGKVYCAYGVEQIEVRGRLWDGSSWGNVEVCTARLSGHMSSYSVVAIGDDVHIVSTKVNTYDLAHRKRTYGVGWESEVIIQPSTTELTAPALSRYGSDLYCFWLGAPTPYHVYYKRYSDGMWDAIPTDWIDESADGFPPLLNNALIQCSYEAQNDMIGVLYQTKTSAPYLIRHAIYSPFAPPPPTKYILTIGTIGQGTTDPAPGSWEYTEGTEVLVSAIPAAGWAFDHWEGDISTVNNPIKVLMTRDLSITAVFSEVVVPPEEHAVTISVIGEGTTDPVPGAYTVIHGATFTMTAHPATGWNFSHWEGDISETAATVNIEVVGDISVVAVFTEVPAPPPKPTWVWPLAIAGIIGTISVIIVATKRK